MTENGWNVDVLLAGSWRGATSVLLSQGRRHVVVDTGMPHESPMLVAALEQRGLRPADICNVINTHFHIDHVLNNSLFSNSTFYASQQSYDWCCSLYSDLCDKARWEKLVLKYYPETFDYERAGALMGKLRKMALRWWDLKRLGHRSRFRWTETNALPEGLESFVTEGHVPGHLSIVVHTPSEHTVIAGDAVLSRDAEAEVLTMIPHQRRRFELDRARLLSLGGRVLPGHDAEFVSPGAVEG
ncbi:MAG TPA: MBL fold metallo-hydrolase [Terriglobia bacterium]|jgi:N-acyl homoserine lactone hydrolase|nr:MBL fold metallo-hydrolase [Terriglobia bacterium]